MTEFDPEIAALENLNGTLMTSLESKLMQIGKQQTDNLSLLEFNEPLSKADEHLKSYIERGCDEKSCEGLRYMTNKLVILEDLIDMLEVTPLEKQDYSVDDEKYVFMESKNLMERLKPNTSNTAQKIANTFTEIEVVFHY
jgi:hypothetical protein